MEDRVIIVASGSSARKFDFSRVSGCRIIAVNGVIEWIPHCDDWFTLDPSPANVVRMEKRREGVVYCCAAPRGFVLPDEVIRLNRVHVDYDDSDDVDFWIKRWSCHFGLRENMSEIATGNSAYGALNLAYHSRPKKILLVGVDGTQDERVEGGKPNNLSHLNTLFKSALPQLDRAGIEIRHAGNYSRVSCIESCKGEEWIMR